MISQSDEYFMQIALQEAQLAYREGEVPVGAVITCNGQIIAKAHNQTQKLNDVTAHAEMLVITAASNFLGAKYLNQCTLYVTLEPCIMCAGATYWSQIKHIVFAAKDPKAGFLRLEKKILHPKTKLTHNIMSNESSALLKSFFEKKRIKNKS